MPMLSQSKMRHPKKIQETYVGPIDFHWFHEFLTASPRGPIPIFGHFIAAISCFVGKSCQLPSSTAKYRLNDCQVVIR